MNCTTRLALFAAALLVAGCNAQTDSKPAAPAAGASADPYDVSKMDFKPGPAQVTNERHTGAILRRERLEPGCRREAAGRRTR